MQRIIIGLVALALLLVGCDAPHAAPASSAADREQGTEAALDGATAMADKKYQEEIEAHAKTAEERDAARAIAAKDQRQIDADRLTEAALNRRANEAEQAEAREKQRAAEAREHRDLFFIRLIAALCVALAVAGGWAFVSEWHLFAALGVFGVSFSVAADTLETYRTWFEAAALLCGFVMLIAHAHGAKQSMETWDEVRTFLGHTSDWIVARWRSLWHRAQPAIAKAEAVVQIDARALVAKAESTSAATLDRLEAQDKAMVASAKDDIATAETEILKAAAPSAAAPTPPPPSASA